MAWKWGGILEMERMGWETAMLGSLSVKGSIAARAVNRGGVL